MCIRDRPNAGYYAPFELGGIEDEPGQYLTDRLTDFAEEFITENQDKPFFLYLSHFAVHDPIQGRSDLVGKYSQKLASVEEPNTPSFILEGNPDDLQPLNSARLAFLNNQSTHQDYKVLPDRTVKIKQHQDNVEFAAMVESMDESLGRIVDHLEELGLTDNTLIVFFSDNGGMSGANFGGASRIAVSYTHLTLPTNREV